MSETPTPESPQTPDETISGPMLLRRALIVLTATLIVARPLVLGEEPGLSDHLADPWGMVLTLLWILTAAGWAAYRFWLRAAPASDETPNPRHWYGGIVQLALLATVAVMFLSAQTASYKFPARLIAFEWLGLFVAFFAVRQLAVTPAEQSGLFAVALASVVSLAAQGIYQELVIMPEHRQLAEDPAKMRAAWQELNPMQHASDNEIEWLRQRAKQDNIFGPYAHPNSYAGFLVLWLPGLIGVVLMCLRTQAPKWQTVLTACCAVLGLAALWLTHSRGALLGLAAAGGCMGAIVWRQTLRCHALVALLALVVLAALGFGAWRSELLTTGMGKTTGTMEYRLQYWRTSWQMIREQPWLGVGPGNFGENYTRLMPVTADEKIKAPHNFALETWAVSGLFAVFFLLTALSAFFYQVFPWLRDWVVNPQPSNNSTNQPADLRWAFYLSGMFGLLLGFVLRVTTASPGTIVSETWAAAIRGVVWFAAYGLLERITWSHRGRVIALTTGIAALLMNLCVSDGISYPSVAGMLWIAVALALNAAALKPVAWLSRARWAMIVPLPIFVALLLAYGYYVLYPVLAADSLVREAITAVGFYQDEQKKPPSQRVAILRNEPERFIQEKVIQRLQEAAALTPGDARLFVQLAWWTGNQWDIKRQRTGRADAELETKALQFGKLAVNRDPQGSGGYLVQYHLRMARFGSLHERTAEQKRKKEPLVAREQEVAARHEYELAARTLERFLPNDPHDAGLRYELADAWIKAGDEAKGQAQAVEALRLDDLALAPARKLTDRQREQLRTWLGMSSAG